MVAQSLFGTLCRKYVSSERKEVQPTYLSTYFLKIKMIHFFKNVKTILTLWAIQKYAVIYWPQVYALNQDNLSVVHVIVCSHSPTAVVPSLSHIVSFSHQHISMVLFVQSLEQLILTLLAFYTAAHSLLSLWKTYIGITWNYICKIPVNCSF